VGELVGEKAAMIGLKEVDVVVKGVGAGRESSIRAFNSKGIDITLIRDVTPVPHNGPKPPKPRKI
ncbi:MAG: small ribosomal subunit protein uS11, partial [Minisyncoccota bacterium]